MHGEGMRHTCGECGRPIGFMDDRGQAAWGELRGPRNITSSNIDRILDDGGKRFLVIEHKNEHEAMPRGQRLLLQALASQPAFDVWVTVGPRHRIDVYDLRHDGRVALLGEGDWAMLQGLALKWFNRW